MSVLILVSNGAIQCSNRICSQDQSKISTKFVKISPKHQKSTCWNLGTSVLIWVSNGDTQRSNRICSQDQHAQAQHWLRHAQHWPRTLSRSRQGGGLPPLALFALGSSANAEHAWANVESEHAHLGYISCCCVGCHHSKPKSKLTSPDFNMWPFGVLDCFWQMLNWFWTDFGYISCCCVGWHHSKPKSKLTSPNLNM